MKYKILIVDDESGNVRLLERLFRAEYEVLTATSGAEALELLELHDIALIISDQRMPGMTGIDFLKRSAEIRLQTVRMMLTGYTDANALAEAINSGVVYKYITKPWVNQDLLQTVRRALQHYETIKGQHQLFQQTQRLKERLTVSRDRFVELVSELAGMKDGCVPGHARRVSDFAVATGRSLDLEPRQLDDLRLAALLHEAAHAKLPSESLIGSPTLSEGEADCVRQSFEWGLELIGKVPDLEEAALVIRYIHENYDGTGYAEGLSGERIPLNARIIAVVDAYDDMTEQRGLSHDEAMKRLRADSGTKFDPDVVAAFCDMGSNTETYEIVADGQSLQSLDLGI